jgi:hypothetical protein
VQADGEKGPEAVSAGPPRPAAQSRGRVLSGALDLPAAVRSAQGGNPNPVRRAAIKGMANQSTLLTVPADDPDFSGSFVQCAADASSLRCEHLPYIVSFQFRHCAAVRANREKAIAVARDLVACDVAAHRSKTMSQTLLHQETENPIGSRRVCARVCFENENMLKPRPTQ